MISTQAKMLNFAMKIFMIKKLLGIVFRHPPRARGDIVPKSIKSKFAVSEIVVNGKKAVTVKSKQNTADKHILLLHGGGYIMQAAPPHWKLVQRIIETTGFTVTLVDYPLAPEQDYRETHEMVHNTFQQLSQMYAGGYFYLMGDSAGGGLALALLQALRDKGVENLPAKTVLFSPWVDVGLTNPKIKEIEGRDSLLSVDALQKAGILYANGGDLKSPMLSPLYGEMHNLGKIALFVGTDEVFLADCQALKEKIEATNTELRYFEYLQMQHDWPLFPIPEAKKAVQQACDFLQD
jgi:epsilon-lactone hydrolase